MPPSKRLADLVGAQVEPNLSALSAEGELSRGCRGFARMVPQPCPRRAQRSPIYPTRQRTLSHWTSSNSRQATTYGVRIQPKVKSCAVVPIANCAKNRTEKCLMG